MSFRDALDSFMLDQQLAFSSLLDQDSIRKVFAKHGALFGHLKQGDVVVADRHYCSYWMIWTLLKLGIQVCSRKHQKRHGDAINTGS